MYLTYRYKLAPKRKQYSQLDEICEAQRQLYNAALQERRDAWAKQKVSISKIDQFKSLTQIRSFDPTYGSIPACLSRWSITRVDDAMKGFFSRVKRGQKAGLNRAMLDASPARLIELLTYKAERAGRKLVKVDPQNTSQNCSSCGAKVAKALSERRHVCGCGADLHRDHNAALNILQLALQAHGRGRPPGDVNVGQWPVRCLGNTDGNVAKAA